MNTIYTIGHSTRSITDFIAMLHSFGIKTLADVRSYPGSKWQPQFNRTALEAPLKEAGVAYLHMPELGGKRKPPANAGGEQPFGGYTTYMKTSAFATAIQQLEKTAIISPTAYMCAEADWQQCHRSLISDHLKKQGWLVLHITGVGERTEHPLRHDKPVQGNLF